MKSSLDLSLPVPHVAEAVVTQGQAAGKREVGLLLCSCSTEAAEIFLKMKNKNYH